MISPSRLQRAWLVLLLVAPLVLVVACYAWLAIAHGTPWLWNVVVHEGGRYTLGETVFFVRHHLREIPVDMAMALSLAAAIRMTVADPPVIRRNWLAGGAILLVVLAFAMASMQEGWREAARDLLQFRTRDDDSAYGSHWRFHLLSTVWFCCAAPVVAGITTGVSGFPRLEGESRRLLVAAWIWIGVLTLSFGVNADPFTSGRYIGHQAREIMTHGLITLPLVFAIGVMPGRVVQASRLARSGGLPRMLAWIPVLGIPLFLAAAFRGTTLEGSAQLETGLAGVVAAHVFEHILDVVLVLALTMVLAGSGGSRAPTTGVRS